ncbi:MbtH family protein [Streptomyces sp. NPDC088923]|uniref:MbtH family protein n=1 Tax=Streptomyces sp. NPDC088923 TaxID=3365913 RepID=UPI0038170F70
MTNPFEDDKAEYTVLVNDQNQHSLWPASLGVPEGWTTALPRTDRSACLAYVEEHWTDLRPAGVGGAT